MIETKESLEKKIKELIKNKTELMSELNKVQLEINKVEEEYLSLREDFVKVECFGTGCNGSGYVRGEDKKLRSCSLCGGNGYRWMKKYVEQKTKKD